jgi:GT2 family glycosyltransferase
MNILIISEYFNYGGLETQILGQVRVLKEFGYKVYIATGSKLNSEIVSTFDGYICDIPMNSNDTCRDTFYTFKKIVVFAEENQIQLIHAHPFRSLLPALFVSCKLKIPFVLTIHGPASIQSFGPVHDKLFRTIILPEASHVFCVSKELKTLVQPYVRSDNCTILINAVNTKLFQRGNLDYKNKWALVGRIDDFKIVGMKDFLMKSKEIELARVDVYGDGPARSDLECFVEKQGLSDIVSFKGYTNKLHEDLKEGYSGLAGMGRVVLESAAMDLPIILIGYDGTKGLLDQNVLEKAGWWNYSGRGLENVSSEEFKKQVFDNLKNNHDRFCLRSWVEANANDDIIWRKYIDNINKLNPYNSSITLKVLELFKSYLGRNIPYSYDEELLSDIDDLLETECPSRVKLGKGRIDLYKLNKLNQQLTMLVHVSQQQLQQQSFIELDKLFKKNLQTKEQELKIKEQTTKKLVDLQIIISQKEEEVNNLQNQILSTQNTLSFKESEIKDVYSSRRYRIANKAAIILWYLKHPNDFVAKLKTKTFIYLKRVLSAPTKHWIKKVILRQNPQPWQPPQQLPIKKEESSANRSVNFKIPSKYDIIVFSIIDWGFRFQRPQQIANILSKHGHRVFYLSTGFNNSTNCPTISEVIDNVFEVRLPGSGNLNVYRDSITVGILEDFYKAMVYIIRNYKIADAVCLIQLPFWSPLVLRLREKHGWKIVYDCMDKHSGFSTNDNIMLSEEEKLVQESDLVIVTARQLYNEQKIHNENCKIIPNAVDFNHFSSYLGQLPIEIMRLPKPIIGYYGAISDWFDVSIVKYLADKRSNWQFVLIGSTFGADVSTLTGLPNVHFLGELSYKELPGYLHGFDVCLIPFKINPLTEATNPVKFYEYLSAGKPVVATLLPELVPYTSMNLVNLANGSEKFLEAIEQALNEDSPIKVQDRIKFARENTWDSRVCEMEEAIQKIFKLASIIIVTYNNLHLTEQCIASIYKNTTYPNLELIIVDNASTDGTQDFLKRLDKEKYNVKIVLNEVNKGFAGGNNQGIQIANGEYLVLLNNDTVVTYGWLGKLINILEKNKMAGMAGPVTNSAGNEAQIDVNYTTIEEMEKFAEEYTARFEDNHFEVEMLAMFCVIAKSSVIKEVGPLDEQFGLGMFEDDDYAMRIKEKGYIMLCTKEVFIHHFGKSSFKQFSEEKYFKLFEENRKKFEIKWNKKWEPPILRKTTLPEEERNWVLGKELEWILEKHKGAKRVIIYPPTIDWGETLFQRPQQLALAFAKLGYLFIYCVVNPSVDKVSGFKEIENNLYLCYVPLEIFKIIKRPVVWISRPDHFDKLIYFDEPYLVYDYIDELEVFHTYGPQLIKNHNKLIKKANLCLATAKKLLKEVEENSPNTLFCPNGTDFAFFSQAQSKKEHKIPSDLEQLVSKERPLIGYYGALAKWFDYGLVEYAAKRRKDYNFVLIGPDYDQTLEKSGLLHANNIFWLGPKKYQDLLGYLAFFDVATIPFKINNITLATNPIKLFEYASAGKPIVTTAMPECKQYPEVLTSEDQEEFVKNLDKALILKNDTDFTAKLIELGKNNSWETRVKDVSARF